MPPQRRQPPPTPPELPPPPARLPPTPTRNGSAAELWVCLDFEWTCDEGEDRQVHSEEGEIVEFSYAVFDARAGEVACDGQHYCKNLRTPITKFCTDLTGITPETLADAGSLEDALHALQRALSADGIFGRPCCAVTHGSADLELMLPLNCRAQGLEVPRVLRRYVDLREAVQTHLTSKGVRGTRASTLRQICEALNVEMIGEEHCGLDDSWMVLMATQQLLQAGADLYAVDLDAERSTFLAGSCSHDLQRLCLDGLPFFAIGSEVRPWLEGLTGCALEEEALLVVLGMDGRPTGRAVVDFGNHQAAVQALRALDGGRRIVCGSLDSWPFEYPKERLVLARPLRRQERCLHVVGEGGAGGPALAPFPPDAEALTRLRAPQGKGRGKGAGNRPRPATGCEGIIKVFNEGKGFGFIVSSTCEVFVHRSDCPEGPPAEGDHVTFDVVEDPRNGKMKAVNVLRCSGFACAASLADAAAGDGGVAGGRAAGGASFAAAGGNSFAGGP